MKYCSYRHNRIRIMFGLLALIIVLTACTQTWIPVETRIIPSPSAPVETPERSTPTLVEETSGVNYSVVWVEAEETLTVTKPAGISGMVVSELAYGQRGIQLTGSSTGLGSSTWVEIIIPSGLSDAMSKQAQAERERQARIILGTAEAEISQKFAEASEKYLANPVALQLRGMNMLYEGLKEKGSLIIVPSSALESMNLGAIGGLAALAETQTGKSSNKETSFDD